MTTTTENRTETLMRAEREMLARFDERAPIYDRNNAFFTEDFEELPPVGVPHRRAPDRVRRRGPEPRRGQAPAAPARLRRAGDGDRGEHALLLRRPVCRPAPRRRPVGRLDAPQGCRRRRLRGRARRGGQRHRRCCCRRRKAERVDGGWEITGHKIFGSLSPVWTYLGVHAMDTSDPDNPKIVHAFVPATPTGLPHRGDVGHARHAGDGVATTRSSTASFVPDEATIAGVPGRLRRRRDVPGGAVRLGACSASRASTPSIAQRALRRHRRADARAHVDRADAVDGVPPRGAAPRRRDAHPPRSDRRAPRSGERRLVEPASTTAWTGRSRSSRPSTTS